MWIVPVEKHSVHSSNKRVLRDRWTSEAIGGVFDRQGRRFIVFDVDATRQAAAPSSTPLWS